MVDFFSHKKSRLRSALVIILTFFLIPVFITLNHHFYSSSPEYNWNISDIVFSKDDSKLIIYAISQNEWSAHLLTWDIENRILIGDIRYNLVPWKNPGDTVIGNTRIAQNELGYFSKDSEKLIILSDDDSYHTQLRLLNVQSFEELTSFIIDVPFLLDYSPDGNLIATADYWDDINYANSLNIYDLNTLGKRYVDKNIKGWRDIEFSPDGQYLATVGGNGQILIREVTNPSDAIMISRDMSAYSIGYSNDGRQIAIGGESSITIWDYKGNSLLATVNGLEKVIKIVFSPDGKKIAAISSINGYWGDLVILNMDSMQTTIVKGFVQNLRFSSDSKNIACEGDLIPRDPKVSSLATIYEVDTGKEIPIEMAEGSYSRYVFSTAMLCFLYEIVVLNYIYNRRKECCNNHEENSEQ